MADDPAVETLEETPAVEAPTVETAEPSTSPVEAPDEFQSIRDAASGFDYDLSSYDNDEAAFRHLVDRSKEFDRQAETIRQYEQALQQQQIQIQNQPAQPATSPVEETPSWQWTPPPYNRSWLSQSERDPETGQLRPVNGGSPSQNAQLQNFMDYRAENMDRFWTEGPHEYMKPYLEDRDTQQRESMKEEFQKMIDASLGKQHANTEADRFLTDNPWVYQRDANEQVIRNTITGNQELSEEGKMFASHLAEAEQWGMPAAHQQAYAMKMLEAHRTSTGEPATSAGDKKKQEFVRAAAGMPAPAGGSETNLTPDVDGNVPPQNPALSLEDMLRQNLKAEGVTDKDMQEIY